MQLRLRKEWPSSISQAAARLRERCNESRDRLGVGIKRASIFRGGERLLSRPPRESRTAAGEFNFYDDARCRCIMQARAAHCVVFLERRARANPFAGSRGGSVNSWLVVYWIERSWRIFRERRGMQGILDSLRLWYSGVNVDL